MIGNLDSVLGQLLKENVTLLRAGTPATVTAEQISFQPPDDGDWRGHLTALGTRKALNVYLFDLRENRRLRSNERVRSVHDGIASDEPAPARMDCHYLITAWSPATEDQGRTLEEHQLLHEVANVLMNNAPLVPRKVFSPAPLPAGFPVRLADAELPSVVAPPDGFPKLAEFWGAMGVQHRWKPAIYLIVTVPVLLETEISGPVVTTSITQYLQRDKPETAEVWIQIGGHVLDTVNPLPDGSPRPVAAARVEIRDAVSGELAEQTETDVAGRYRFVRLRAGRYKLLASAPGLTMASPRAVVVPSLTGEYDLKF
jgi:hypothetical protein